MSKVKLTKLGSLIVDDIWIGSVKKSRIYGWVFYPVEGTTLERDTARLRRELVSAAVRKYRQSLEWHNVDRGDLYGTRR